MGARSHQARLWSLMSAIWAIIPVITVRAGVSTEGWCIVGTVSLDPSSVKQVIFRDSDFNRLRVLEARTLPPNGGVRMGYTDRNHTSDRLKFGVIGLLVSKHLSPFIGARRLANTRLECGVVNTPLALDHSDEAPRMIGTLSGYVIDG